MILPYILKTISWSGILVLCDTDVDRITNVGHRDLYASNFASYLEVIKRFCTGETTLLTSCLLSSKQKPFIKGENLLTEAAKSFLLE